MRAFPERILLINCVRTYLLAAVRRFEVAVELNSKRMPNAVNVITNENNKMMPPLFFHLVQSPYFDIMIPHNVFIKGKLIIEANFRHGVHLRNNE